MTELNDTQIAALMKLALEFNAGILALCTVYYGNMDTPKNQKRFISEYKKMNKEYKDRIYEILGKKKEKNERTNV